MMNLRFSTYLTLLLAAFVFLGCQDDQDQLVPTTIATDATTFEVNEDFEGEDADLLELDAEVYVSPAELGTELKVDIEADKWGSRATTVYTQTNDPAGNEVVFYTAADDGTLTETARYATGGTGSGDNLANQAALFLDNYYSLLYAVNAGSSELSVFYVYRDGSLHLLDKVATQGTRPVSVTAYGNIVYVVNAGTDDVEGFRLRRNGTLRSLPNSVRPLSASGTAPAQISFKPNGRALMVTEKATNTITSFAVRRNGRLSNPNTTVSAGATPFGFDFLRGRTIVSEAAGGDENAATVSVYRLRNNGTVRLLNGPVAVNQTATCWVSTNRRTGNVLVTNTASSNISSLALAGNGLTFTNGGEVTPAVMTPHDIGQNRAGTYAYVVTIGSDEVLSYRVGANGALTQIDADGGIGDFSSGIVVRR